MLEHSASLPEKVERVRKELKKLCLEYRPWQIHVAWTGGKDSTTVLWLWKNVLQETASATDSQPRALRVDTGLDFPEIEHFCQNIVQEWGIRQVTAVAGPHTLANIDLEDTVTCCHRLKIEPMRRAVKSNGVRVLITGLRQEENPSRGRLDRIEERSEPSYLQANPLRDWTEMDIWSFILNHGLPYCSLYDQGYRSLDCRPCTEKSDLEERRGRNPEKEEQMERLRSLGYF